MGNQGKLEIENMPESPDQQINLHAIGKALALLRSVQTLKRTDKDSVEHLLGWDRRAFENENTHQCPAEPPSSLQIEGLI
jgi:hypothetical protein